MKEKLWMISPAMFFAMLGILILTWGVMEPCRLVELFDKDGRSPVELATLPVFLSAIPLVWLLKPFDGGKTRVNVLSAMVTVVALMAVVKELDLHNDFLHWAFPQFVDAQGDMAGNLLKPNGSALTGTPFKMRVLTNAGVPLMMKAAIVLYFISFFGVFGAGFLYLFKSWVKGVFSLDVSSWMWGAAGASGVIVQLADRITSWLGRPEELSRAGESVSSSASLITALEEGSELMLAIFAVATIVSSALSRRLGKGQKPAEK